MNQFALHFRILRRCLGLLALGLLIAASALHPGPALSAGAQQARTPTPAATKGTATVEPVFLVESVIPAIPARTIAFRAALRNGPGLTYNVVTVATAGTSAAVIGRDTSGRWLLIRIRAEREPVWIPEMLIELSEPLPTSTAGQASPTPRSTATGEASTDASPPITTTEIISTAVNLIVDALTTPATPVGGAATAVATTLPPTPAAPTATPVPTPSVPTAYTRPARMNVRSGPGTDYSIVTGVPANTAVQVLAYGPSGQWLQVQLADGAEPAWIFGPLTVLAGDLSALPTLTEEQIPPRPAPEPVRVAVADPVIAPAVAPQVVHAPAPTGGGGFGYGVQAHMVHTGQEGVVMEKTRELGFGWVKQQIEWKIFESNPGQYGFGDIGPIVGAANGRGISLLFSVVNAPDWAREPGFDPNVGGPPADPQTYANFVGRLAGEYCGTSLKAIEVWNEQNLHYEWGNRPLNPAEYMNLLRPAYAAIKAACPSMLVISGALTPAGNNGNYAMDDFAYLEAMFQNGLANYADGIGAHPSGYNVPPTVGWQQACDVIQQTGNIFNGACDNPHHSWSFRSTMEGYRNIAVVYGAANKRIWPTEFGWAAGGAFDPRYAYADDNSLDEQAVWTVEAYKMMREWGWVGPAFLWNLNFRVVADGTEKAQWGIVTNDWRPLPIFYALRDMVK